MFSVIRVRAVNLMMTWLQAQCSMDFSAVSRSFMFTCIRRCRGLPINHESNVLSDIDQSLACTSWMPSFTLTLTPYLLVLECPRDFLLCSAAERLPSTHDRIVCASKFDGNVRSVRVQHKRQLWVGLPLTELHTGGCEGDAFVACLRQI